MIRRDDKTKWISSLFSRWQVLNILLKKAERDEQALMTTLAGLVVVLMLMISEIGNLFETVRETFGI